MKRHLTFSKWIIIVFEITANLKARMILLNKYLKKRYSWDNYYHLGNNTLFTNFKESKIKIEGMSSNYRASFTVDLILSCLQFCDSFYLSIILK